jgi:hypothetical protein
MLHIYLEPGLVERVAAEAVDLDPARLTVPPLDSLELPHLRAAMGAVSAELTAGGAGAARRRVVGQRPGRPPDPARPRPPAGLSAGGTAHCRGGGSAPSSSTRTLAAGAVAALASAAVALDTEF